MRDRRETTKTTTMTTNPFFSSLFMPSGSGNRTAAANANNREICNLYVRFLKKIYGNDANDETLYKQFGNLGSLYKKNKHLVYNVIVVPSMNFFLNTKFAQIKMISDIRDFQEYAKKFNVLLLVVNLGICAGGGGGIGELIELYASQSTVYLETRELVANSGDHQKNVLEPNDLNNIEKIKRYIRQEKRCTT